uniref:Small ribosomal subunit protein uS4c n=1 Tax=Jenufa perforata TaxID=993091 RepID=A0A0S2LN53_9CHLO|nr:ribosomal protein S4 [Jenufa perforata]ALO62901.1 ribosomal protein S4 [Jenufa perforata]
MSRYLGPRLRIVRRIGKLRGFTRKKPFRRSFRGKGPLSGKVIPPGQHGLTKLFKSRESDYLIRLKVKQRLRFHYGLSEKQLRRYVQKAKKIKESTGQILLQLLEMRLDNIVFRLNMAPTIVAARQIISHGHIHVNNKKVNIPSYLCKPKDIISVVMKEKSLKLIQKNIQESSNKMNFYKKRLEKTLAFVLFKLKMVPNMTTALQLINQGNVQINNKKTTSPQTICYIKDVITVLTPEGSRQIQLNNI